MGRVSPIQRLIKEQRTTVLLLLLCSKSSRVTTLFTCITQVYVGKKPHVYRVIILKQMADYRNNTLFTKNVHIAVSRLDTLGDHKLAIGKTVW